MSNMLKYTNAILRMAWFSKIQLVFKPKPILRKNVFDSTSTSKVLLSYVASAFDIENQLNQQHTNYYTSYIFGSILNELGYAVDVINYTDSYPGDYTEYEAVIGLGESVENALLVKNNKTKIIYFATGCNPFYCNQNTIQRVIDFYNKHGKLAIASSRFQAKDFPLQHEASDWIILHGSTFAKSTFRDYKIHTVFAPVFINHSPDIENKDWEKARKNYLWFGSSGLIHKGLDLVIDACIQRKDINLHICGNLESEPDFYQYFKKATINYSHIFYHGYMDICSNDYVELLQSCAFVLFPSTSEGNSPSVITCMANGGLIPIVTASTDVDIIDYGIEIESLSIDGVKNAITISQGLSIEELKKQSNQVIKTTLKYHTFDFFKENIYKILKKIL